MSKLPKYAALKSACNGKYLRYLDQTSDPKVRTFLQYSANEILSPFTKFEFEQAMCDPNLYNIKCSYNNKYWSSFSSDRHYIVADAYEKQEDKSKWNCTLFRPIYDNCKKSYRFCHVNLGLNVVMWNGVPPFIDVLRAELTSPDINHCDLNVVIDLEPLITLPRHVAFKGDNGCYLSALKNDGFYLHFSSNNIEDDSTHMETFTTKDGRIQIKSIKSQTFWKRDSHDWILANAHSNPHKNIDGELFSPTKFSTTIVALRDLGNNKFAKRYNGDEKINGFRSISDEPDKSSHLEMTELVWSREIQDVKFQLGEAKVDDIFQVALSHREASNNTDTVMKAKIFLPYTTKRSSQWNSSISTKLDVKTMLESGIPIIVDRKTVIMGPDKFNGEYKWGEPITTTKNEQKIYEVTIPPKYSINVTLVATWATFQVPFSYKQTDILIDGSKFVHIFEDGVYLGRDYYNFRIETKFNPISGCPN